MRAQFSLMEENGMNKLKSACPNCGKTLYRGPLRFGPEVVQCKRCNTTITTGLTKWSDLSILARTGNTLKELVSPSFLLGLDDFFIRLFLLVPAAWVFFGFPFMIPILLVTDKTIHFQNDMAQSIAVLIAGGLAIAGGCVYPFVVIRRYIKLIVHSYQFDRKGTLPRW